MSVGSAPPAVERRPPIGRTIALVFRTIAQHWRVCIAIAAVYAVPWGIANAVSRSSTRILDPRTLTDSQVVSAGIAGVLSIGAMVLIAVFLGSITLGALSLVGSAAVYGDRVDSRGIVSRATDRALDAVAANLLVSLMIAAGPVLLGMLALAVALVASSSAAFTVLVFGFFIVVGPVLLYLLVRLGLAVPIVMREGRGPIDSLQRSRQLTAGSSWWVFAIGVVLAIVPVVIQRLAEVFIGRGGAIDFLLWVVAGSVVATLGAMLVGVGAGVIYGSLAPEDVVPPDVARSEARADEEIRGHSQRAGYEPPAIEALAEPPPGSPTT